MDVGQTDAIALQLLTVEQEQNSPVPEKSSVPEKSPARAQEAPTNAVEEQRTTEGSFHSAKEDMTSLEISKELSEPPEAAVEENASNDLVPEIPLQSIPGSFPPQNLATVDAMDLGGIENESALEDNNSIDVLGSPSEGSSPVKPLIRKSSLTFAALPAREPLTTKKSIGSRISGTAHLEQSRATMNRGSFLGRYTGGKSLGGTRQPDHINNGPEDSLDVDQAEMPHISREESDGDAKMARLHNKSSTQRLHEKINMLGKSQPSRPTKSIPAAPVITHPIYPDLPDFEEQPPTSEQPSSKNVGVNGPDNDDDDDWIEPPQLQERSTAEMPEKSTTIIEPVSKNGNGVQKRSTTEMLEKSINIIEPVSKNGNGLQERSTAEMLEKSIAIVEPASKNGNGVQASTTPFGTPSSKRYVDGPLSASKSKIQSIMKTARGLFTSSAGVSAQAKMETLSPHATRTRSQAQGLKGGDTPRTKLKGLPVENGMFSEIKPDQQVQVVICKPQANTPTKNTEDRKTRCSTEKEEKRKEQEAKERERVDSELERAREMESRKALSKHPQAQSSQLQRPKDLRRPVKPAKETAPKPKPQPVAIRVGTLSQRIPLTNTALSSSLSESLAPPPPKQPGLVKKASNISLQTSSSNTSLKSSTTSSAPKPKALLAAERKKEQVSAVYMLLVSLC